MPHLRVLIVSCAIAAGCGSSTPAADPPEVAAWALGADLGNAVVFAAYGKPDRAQASFARATAAAQTLAGAAPGALPEPGTSQTEGDDKVFDYLRIDAILLRAKIDERKGPAVGAAFALSIRTMLTPALYVSSEPDRRALFGKVLAGELRDELGRTGWKTPALDPLLAALEQGAEPRAVQDAAHAVSDAMPAAIRAMAASGSLGKKPAS